jgi:hypothetical protein
MGQKIKTDKVLMRVGDQACALGVGQMNLVPKALNEFVSRTPAVRCFHRDPSSFEREKKSLRRSGVLEKRLWCACSP